MQEKLENLLLKFDWLEIPPESREALTLPLNPPQLLPPVPGLSLQASFCAIAPAAPHKTSKFPPSQPPMPHSNLTSQFYSYIVPRSLLRKQSKLPGAPEVQGKSTMPALLPRQSRKSLLSPAIPLGKLSSHGVYLFLLSSSCFTHNLLY